MNLKRAAAISRKLALDNAAMHRVLSDMEKRAGDKDSHWWGKRLLLRWSLRKLVPHWSGYVVGRQS